MSKFSRSKTVGKFLSVIVLASLVFSTFGPGSINAAPLPTPSPTPTLTPKDAIVTDQSVPNPPFPKDQLSSKAEKARAQAAMEVVLQKYLDYWGPRYQLAPVQVNVNADWARGIAQWQSTITTLSGPINILAHRGTDGAWQAVMPDIDGPYLQWLEEIPESLVPASEKSQMRAQAEMIIPVDEQLAISSSALEDLPSPSNQLSITTTISKATPSPISSTQAASKFQIMYVDAGQIHIYDPVTTSARKVGSEFSDIIKFTIVNRLDFYTESPTFQIIADPGYILLHGLLSADGRQAIYLEAACQQNQCTPNFQLWLVDLELKQRRMMLSNSNSPQPGLLFDPIGWSLTKNEIYLDTLNPINEGGGFQGLWRLSLDTNTLSKLDLGDGGYNSRPLLSPDEKWLLFTGFNNQAKLQTAPFGTPSNMIKLLSLDTYTVQAALSRSDEWEYFLQGWVRSEDIPAISTASSSLIGIQDIPEATSGFQRPMTNYSSGHIWKTYAEYPGGWVYHPGWDYNGAGGCNSDFGVDVQAVANGQVVYRNTSNWGGMVVQHLYQGTTVYSQYGHISSGLYAPGQNVSKGDHIAEVGNTGATCAHLHWEIRESDHPNPNYGAYWDYNVLKSDSQVENYYENPQWWADNHGPYGGCNNSSPGSDQIMLYADPNYCGSSKILNIGEYSNPGAMGFANDAASSIKVGSSVKGILCKDDNYAGGCEEFTGNDSDLGNNGIGNDSVSSVKVQSQSTSCNPNADQIALYVDQNYGGQCVVKGIGDYTNPGSINLPNDSISSIKVGSNVKATLCKDDNYAGGCEDFTGNDSDLGNNTIGNDSVSSVKVQSQTVSCSPNADQVGLYLDSNYGGQCVVKGIGDYPNPGSINLPNDSISSVKVGNNVKATLCRDDNYSGGCDDFTSDDNDLGNNSIGNDSVSSVKVQPRAQAPASPNLQSPGNGSTFNEGENITLYWSATGDQYYGEVWGGPGSTLTFGWQNETQKSIGSQWAGYTYSWHVKAKNSAGASDWSSTWTFTVKPGTPSLSAQTVSCSQINLYWNNSSGSEEGYKIYRNGSYINQVGSDVTSYQDSGLSGNTGYAYYVTAYRGGIESNASNTVNISTPTCAPPQPDLVPAQWGGWQYPIVPSSIPSTNVINTLYAGSSTYIDWGLANNGNVNTGGNTYGDLFADDTRVAHYDFGDVLAGQSWAFQDWNETINTPGWHTLKVVVDPDNLIAESDETNNVWEYQFYWVASAPYSDSMESGVNNWTATGLWHQISDTSPYPNSLSPTHSWWYGQDNTGNYDTGAANAGDLASPSLYVPAAGYYLRFWYWYETETQGTNWDQRWVQISVDDGPFNNILQLYDDPKSWWLQSPAIDLSGYAGHTVQVRFHFDSIDGTFNDYWGWYIDDFSITTTPPPTCADTHEPNDNASQATAISYGQTLSADICPGGDYDWYTFSGLANDKVIVDIDAIANSSWLDSYVYLVNSDGSTVLTFNDDDGSTTDSKLGYTLPHDGTYYLKARAWNHPSVGGPSYFYNLRLYTDNTDPASAAITAPSDNGWLNPSLTTVTASTSDGESGINHVEFLWHDADWQNSNWIWLGADYYGSDGWSFDFDTSGLPEQQGGAFYIWAFDWAGNWLGAGAWNLGVDRTPPSATINISLMYGGAPFRDFSLWWYGSDNLSGVFDYDVQSRDGLNGSWTNLLTGTSNTYYHFVGQDGHTYYFRIRARDLVGNQSTYTGGNGDAQQAIQICPTPSDAFESDNAYASAKLITTNGITQTHTIHLAGDQDWVKFTAFQGITYTITTANMGGFADTVIDLYGTNGSTLLGSNDDDPNNWPASRLQWKALAGGVYYVKVKHFDTYAYGCSTAYSLSIVPNQTLSLYQVYLPMIIR